MPKLAQTDTAISGAHGGVRVWDPLVRIFHWSLVASFATAWFTSSGRSDFHQWVGLVAAALIAFRIIWGFAGPHYARFAQFIRSPRTTLTYLFDILKGHEARYIGHNPAGGMMVLALLTAIAGTTATGWLMTTDRWYGDDTMQITHSVFAYGTVLLIVSHVSGVILASYRHKENLVKAMVTGKKKAPEAGDVG
ncbi:MAG: cytochrome b/b6 domain-containing protein [Alphaproteobacteria bacterium]|nr:cytochrome b/b6 domain-containing protein [Alphaproteobacteria bacterium]